MIVFRNFSQRLSVGAAVVAVGGGVVRVLKDGVAARFGLFFVDAAVDHATLESLGKADVAGVELRIQALRVAAGAVGEDFHGILDPFERYLGDTVDGTAWLLDDVSCGFEKILYRCAFRSAENQNSRRIY